MPSAAMGVAWRLASPPPSPAGDAAKLFEQDMGVAVGWDRVAFREDVAPLEEGGSVDGDWDGRGSGG